MKHIIYLLLGGNIGDRIHYMAQGREMIAASCGTILRTSAIYETAAWGKEDQQPFLNQAIELETTLMPEDLLQGIHKIEAALGRERIEKWGARTLDVDILCYDNAIIDTENLKIPHPFMQDRRFVLLPLHELKPDLIHPVFEKSIHTLLLECKDPLEAHPYNNFG